MKNLRFYRKRAKMSVSELARIANTTVTSIYRYEHGMRNPDVDVAARLAVALGCTVEDLIAEPKEQTA